MTEKNPPNPLLYFVALHFKFYFKERAKRKRKFTLL